MATFILVHGAFHGGWCWKKFKSLLINQGHEVYTPTLTGLGERSHLASSQIGLGTHIQDIVNVLEYEDLKQVILVGHSYGGMVITGVADRVFKRIQHLVYLDAFVPKNGQALRHQFSPDNWNRIENRVIRLGDGWRWILPDPKQELSYWGVTSSIDIDWLCKRLVPQSIQTAIEPLEIKNHSFLSRIPRTFIYCTENRPNGTYHKSEVRARTEQGWRYREINTGHEAMVTAPQKLATLLIEIVNL